MVEVSVEEVVTRSAGLLLSHRFETTPSAHSAACAPIHDESHGTVWSLQSEGALMCVQALFQDLEPGSRGVSDSQNCPLDHRKKIRIDERWAHARRKRRSTSPHNDTWW
jgi:hypothetical protein